MINKPYYQSMKEAGGHTKKKWVTPMFSIISYGYVEAKNNNHAHESQYIHTPGSNWKNPAHPTLISKTMLLNYLS